MVKINYLYNGEKRAIEVNTEDKFAFENIFMATITIYPFQIEDEEQRKEWNTYARLSFDELDDYDILKYNQPFVDSDEWYVYEGRYLKKIKKAIRDSEEHLDYLKILQLFIERI